MGDLKRALRQQQNEINDYAVYRLLAQKESDPNNKSVFEKIADEERGHYEFWKNITKTELKPSRFVAVFYTFLVFMFGTSFALKLLEDYIGQNIKKVHLGMLRTVEIIS